jgi:hypothetical protein
LALAGCSSKDGLDGAEDSDINVDSDAELEELQQALTGNGMLKVADTAANLRTITGGTTLWVAVLQGISSAGDGGGGVFYWSTVFAADDGWSVLNSASGNSAGWRRVKQPAVMLEGPSIEAVISSPGAFAGHTQVCSTRLTGVAGGGAELIWSTSTATVDGVDVYASFPGQGSWRRRKYGLAPFARSTTIRANGSADDTAALENTCNALFKNTGGAGPQGNYLHLEPGDVVRTTATININATDHAPDSGIIGQRSSPTNYNTPRIMYDGTGDGPVFAISQSGFTFQGLTIFPNNGRSVQTVIDQQFRGTAVTKLRISRCWIGSINNTNQIADYAVTTHLMGPSGSVVNLDYGLIEDSTLIGREAAVRFYKGQPYGWQLRGCHFGSVGGPSAVSGRGVWLDVSEGTVSVESPSFGMLSMAFAFTEGTAAGLSVFGFSDLEKPKCLLGCSNGSFAVGGAGNLGRPISISGGRYNQDNYSVAATNPTIPADNHTYIYNPRGAGPLTLTSCSFQESGVALPGFKIISGSAVTAIGCSFPNVTPIYDIGKTSYIRCTGFRDTPNPITGLLHDELHSV